MRGALLVGIDAYPTSPLDGCVQDAERLATLLRSHVVAPEKNFDVELVTAPGALITRGSLRRRLAKLFSVKSEIALFYFSGHGTENNLGGYLVTPDAAAYDEGIALSEVLSLANRSPATERIIILDCCHSGHLGNLPVVDNSAVLQEGVTILTASRPEQVALQQGGASIFTTLLLNALNGAAADTLGAIPLSNVYHYIDQNLGFFDQRPLFKSYVNRFISLRNIPPVVDHHLLKRLTDFFDTAKAVFPLNKTFEETESSAIPENVARFKILQRYRSAGLVRPTKPEEHLYWAAIREGSCELTHLGEYYWTMAKNGRI